MSDVEHELHIARDVSMCFLDRRQISTGIFDRPHVGATLTLESACSDISCDMFVRKLFYEYEK